MLLICSSYSEYFLFSNRVVEFGIRNLLYVNLARNFPTFWNFSVKKYSKASYKQTSFNKSIPDNIGGCLFTELRIFFISSAVMAT